MICLAANVCPDSNKAVIKKKIDHYRISTESPLFPVISNHFLLPGLWASEECSISMPSICKRKKVWVIEKKKDIPKQHGTCPKGWLYFDYKVNLFSKSFFCFSFVDVNFRM